VQETKKKQTAGEEIKKNVLLSNKEMEQLIPRMVSIPTTITLQVTGLSDWPTDDDDNQLPWNKLSLQQKRDVHMSVAQNSRLFDEWLDSDYKFSTAGVGRYELKSCRLVPNADVKNRPQIKYTGRYVIKPGTKPDVFIINISQSRNMIMEMLSGIFAHWENAGDDQASLVSVEFTEPDEDLKEPWSKYGEKWEAENEKQTAMDTAPEKK